MKYDLNQIEQELKNESLSVRLKKITQIFEGKISLSTSLGIEDQLITHHIATQKLNIEIFTLDTGRLFPQSHNVWQETEDKYGITIIGYYPDAEKIQKWAKVQGTNGIYQSIEARKACCAIRKVEPLNNALNGVEVWVTGLRADQSQSRENVKIIEFDSERNLYKFNPLFDYDRPKVVAEVKENQIPYNSLHDEGFLSIGCAPCTRAIEIGEDERAGRWWWEAEGGLQECGLHVDSSGKITSQKVEAGSHI